MTEYRYCPQCAKPLKDSVGLGEETHPACPDGHFTYYDNPAPTAGALVEKDATYLSLRRAHEPNKGEWELPGGFMQPGETAVETIVRELREETGLVVEPIRFLGTFPSVYGQTGQKTVGVGYLCRVTGGTFQLSKESLEHRWFSLDDLPEMALPDDRAVVEEFRKLRG
jgi:NAD+ diphosphatase